MQDNLAELISSRICHDLISPVGAIGNGLELMEAMGEITPELELVGHSAHSAQAKLKFFRVAFGAASSSQIGGPEAERVAVDMFTGGRLSVRISESWGARERGLVKLFYLLLLCVESSLPRGGEIMCAPTDSGWRITVAGVPVADLPEWGCLTGGHAEVSAKTIQFLLAQQSLAAQSITLTTALSETELALSF
jgi:histidine phosphotransferase ChpT